MANRDHVDSIIDRLNRAVARLEVLKAEKHVMSHEHSRLSGKIEGVKLAMSYLEELN